MPHCLIINPAISLSGQLMQGARAPAPCHGAAGRWHRVAAALEIFGKAVGTGKSSSGSTGRGWGWLVLCQGHAQDQGRGDGGWGGHPWGGFGGITPAEERRVFSTGWHCLAREAGRAGRARQQELGISWETLCRAPPRPHLTGNNSFLVPDLSPLPCSTWPRYPWAPGTQLCLGFHLGAAGFSWPHPGCPGSIVPVCH